MYKKIMLGLLSGLMLLGAAPANAESVLIDKAELKYKAEKAEVNLFGERQNAGYAHNLMLVLKREDGSIITGYKPSIKGGYGFKLVPGQFVDSKSETEQLLLMAKQGDWRVYSEYRIMDFANPKQVKEIFDATDSFGVVNSASLEGNTIKVKTVKDSKPLDVELDPKFVEDIAENRKNVDFSRLYSIAAEDVNNDGKLELITNQQLVVNKNVLADVGAVWTYKGPVDEEKPKEKEDKAAEAQPKSNKTEDILKEVEKLIAELEKDDKSENKKKEPLWAISNMTIMKNNPRDKHNSVNNGAFFKGGMIYPVKMVAPNGEATYPQVMINGDIDRQKALNELLQKDADSYIKKFLQGKTDLAFNVLRADDKLMTIQYISGKEKFTRHNINILPGKKERLLLEDVLNVKDKNLVPLLNVLNTNQKLSFDKNLTDEWYIRDEKLFLSKVVDDLDEVAVFKLEDLHKYIKHPNFKVAATSSKSK